VLLLGASGSIEEVAARISSALGLAPGLEGSSVHALGGTYFAWQVLGHTVRLEPNSYELEGEMEFMLSVTRDQLGEVQVAGGLAEPLARVIARLLADNLEVTVLHELEDAWVDAAH